MKDVRKNSFYQMVYMMGHVLHSGCENISQPCRVFRKKGFFSFCIVMNKQIHMQSQCDPGVISLVSQIKPSTSQGL